DNADIIVDEAVAIFKEKVIEITETERIKTMNTGSEPQIINTVNVTRNIIGSIIIGFVAGVVTVIILEYLDDRIQTETVIEDKLGIPVIGKIRSDKTRGEDQIGRASCRERVEMSVVGGTLKKNIKKGVEGGVE